MGPLLRLAAVTAAAFVAVSFLMFAVDQSEEGSTNQVRAVDGEGERVASETAIDRPAPGRDIERLRESRHSGAREMIDDVNDFLLAPFVGVIESSNVWVQRMVPGVLALLFYGLGGMLLANFLPRQSRRQADWRESTT